MFPQETPPAPPTRLLVFTKPWRLDLPDLARKIAALGLDGIEMPVRPGYPVHPENAARALPDAVRIFRDHGLFLESVAGSMDAATVEACGAAGVPLLRVCPDLTRDETYPEAEARLRGAFDALVPVLDHANVVLGVQNHSGRYVAPSALGLRALLAGYDPRHVAAVWDAAHEALNGVEPEMALDVIWPHLRLVNLKNAVWERVDENGASGEARWKTRWVGGREGLASWPRVTGALARRGGGPNVVCLTAEYSDTANLEQLVAEDVAYARALLSAQGDGRVERERSRP